MLEVGEKFKIPMRNVKSIKNLKNMGESAHPIESPMMNIPPYRRMEDADAERIIKERIDLQKVKIILDRFKSDHPEGIIARALARCFLEAQERMYLYDLVVIEGKGSFIPGLLTQGVLEERRRWLGSDEAVDSVLVPSIDWYKRTENTSMIHASLDVLKGRKFERALLVADTLYTGVTASGVSNLLVARGVLHDVLVPTIYSAFRSAEDILSKDYIFEEAKKDGSFAVIYGASTESREPIGYFSGMASEYSGLERSDDVKNTWGYRKQDGSYHRRMWFRPDKKMNSDAPVNIRFTKNGFYKRRYKELFYHGIQPLVEEFSKLAREEDVEEDI